LQWTSQGEDGSYVDTDPESLDLIIANIITGNSSIFVKASDIYEGARDYYDYSIQPSGEHVLFTANYTKQYRHSFFANYYIFDVVAKTTIPLVADQGGGM
jgi:dipeptidyl-peptidase-4